MSSGECWTLGFDDFLMRRFSCLGEMQGGGPIPGESQSRQSSSERWGTLESEVEESQRGKVGDQQVKKGRILESEGGVF